MNRDLGTVVVVEDDANIADLVDLYLRREGFRVLLAADGDKGLELVGRESPRLVILDVGLPGSRDGFEVCRQLRSASSVPVLFLTAREDEIDRVLGLELGADDYVTKPFSPRELVARVRAVLRRSEMTASAANETVELGALRVNFAGRDVTVGGRSVSLTAREFDVLAYLLGNQGRVLSRQQLIEGVWGRDWFGDERTVDVHVAQLRRKLGGDLPLATIWGVGYRLA
jgi:DNA-binding response OmpR family regulator